MSRQNQVCFNITPIYYGDKGIGTRGDPLKGAKDYYFQCHFSKNRNKGDYRQANTIKELCVGCKQYLYIKPLTKEEIKEKH